MPDVETPQPTPTTQTSIDDDTLKQLRLSLEKSIELKPGDTFNFFVGVMECCVFFKPVYVDVNWSVTPAGGASIDPNTGVFTVDKNAPSGSKYTVVGDVLNGRASPFIDVYIYTQEDLPLVGTWRETAQIACDTKLENAPLLVIQELIFKADQTFSVTWRPFEIYEDYWGNYTYDPLTKELSLEIIGGNYVPEDFVGKGRAYFDEQGKLVLEGIWLGSTMGGTSVNGCGHRFHRN